MRVRFTIVELMIVVAIIAVLAAIGIPAYNQMQVKARFAELYPNAESLVDAMLAYQIATDNDNALVDTGPAGGTAPLGKKARPWTETWGYFTTVGWRPDGDVRGAYEMYLGGVAGPGFCNQGGGPFHGAGSNSPLWVRWFSDLDDDNLNAPGSTCEGGPGTLYQLRKAGRSGVWQDYW